MSVKASAHFRIKKLKLFVTAANKSLRGFEARSLPLDFMT